MTSVIIPTNKPPEFIKATIASIRASTSMPVEIVIVVDESDSYVEPLLSYNGILLVVCGRGGPAHAWNQGLKASTGDLLVLGADDLRFHKGSLEAAVEAHTSILHGYGVVGLNDLHHDGVNHTTHFLFDRRFCKEKMGGVMAFPMYKHFCQDNEILERAKLAGAYTYCRDAIVEHLHPSNGKRAVVGDEAERGALMGPDIELFYKRRSLGFPDDFQPAI